MAFWVPDFFLVGAFEMVVLCVTYDCRWWHSAALAFFQITTECDS